MEGAYFGEVRMFAGNYPPMDWAFCNGQLLPVRAYTALFTIIGITFGGDGINSFALPNMTTRIPLGAGTGGGLTPRPLGESGGMDTYTLDADSTPGHSHNLHGSTVLPSTTSPANGYLGSNAPRTTARYKTANPVPAMVKLHANSVSATGKSTPVSNLQPSLTVSYIICINGEWPERPQ